MLTEAEAKPYSVYIGAGGMEGCRHLRCQIWEETKMMLKRRGYDIELLNSFHQESRILNPDFFRFRSLEGGLPPFFLYVA